MISPLNFFIETRDELKKVVWPTRTEVIRLTGIVIIISIAVGLYIGGLDLLFAKLMEMFIYK